MRRYFLVGKEQAATLLQSRIRQTLARRKLSGKRGDLQKRRRHVLGLWRKVRDYALHIVAEARDIRGCARDLNAAIRLLSRGNTFIKFGRQGVPHERWVQAVTRKQGEVREARQDVLLEQN